MTRELLFRGKRVDNGKWVQGNLNFYEGAFIGVPYQTTHFDEGLQNAFKWIEVDPATVSQFTGLLDKNGTKIFEGSVIDLHQTINGVSKFSVEWNDKRMGWTLRYHANMLTPRTYEYSVSEVFSIEEIEIVGSIHDKEADQ
jgi:uncharacterized phage protein (TIGR01671 family)